MVLVKDKRSGGGLFVGSSPAHRVLFNLMSKGLYLGTWEYKLEVTWGRGSPVIVCSFQGLCLSHEVAGRRLRGGFRLLLGNGAVWSSPLSSL